MKHLYQRAGTEKIHSNFCWCEQITRRQNERADDRDTYVMMFPHEADDKMCRCIRPLIKLDGNDMICRRCEKPLERSM
jgi:hypothetical protein